MREIIAICRSRNASREKVARVLDRYFWRIGDKAWRGRASNACLDRVARELRATATRATAVSIQEVRSSHESRMPLIRIGSKSAFSDKGLAPVASHPAEAKCKHGTPAEANGLAAVKIAALFHDLGKAMVMFQQKLKRALDGVAGEGDAVRHELISALIWDWLFGKLDDQALKARIARTTPADIDDACRDAVDWLAVGAAFQDRRLELSFLQDETRLTFAIGMLILVHHKLPAGYSDHLGLSTARHARPSDTPIRDLLTVAAGLPFWHEAWWLKRLAKDAATIEPGHPVTSLDIALRAALVFSDHLGSAAKVPGNYTSGHLANTKQVSGKTLAADSLSTHVKRVYGNCASAYAMLHSGKHGLPALSESQLPLDITRPTESHPRFFWQVEAANAARQLAATGEGGFFACLLSGTGTGKTRGAPTILAGAAFGDARPERRYFRMTLGLGLRVLASQSAREYVDDLGLSAEMVRVLVGKKPIEFREAARYEDAADGSESLDAIPEWLRVERIEEPVPSPGSTHEDSWLRGLSVDTERDVPAVLARAIKDSGKKAATFNDLVRTPVIAATVDHLMPVASPTASAFLPAAVRVRTSDLILDEIDQYGPEDLAAVARLAFQVGAAGRRLVIMSATLTQDVARTFYEAYGQGWKLHAAECGLRDHVHTLVVSDKPGSVQTNADGRSFAQIYEICTSRLLEAIGTSDDLRNGHVLPPCEGWEQLVDQISGSCHSMHEQNASEISGFRVSIGLVRMTRISHTTALFTCMHAGAVSGRLRLKLCLHSNFPQIHRAWIEKQLKRALTRKGGEADKCLRELCEVEGIFDAAREMGVRDIELVCVTSPVIETGNDLDFDYAILDPSSLRSIVQAAGRVRRHRMGIWSRTNILILGKSPIAMQGGALAMPGVETDPGQDTGVHAGNLDDCPGRLFKNLQGNIDFSRVTAAALLDEQVASPLAREERKLREAMLRLDEEGSPAPLGRYLGHKLARMNLQFTVTRRFRRSTTRNIQYALIGDTLEEAVWHVDLQPGSKFSSWDDPGGALHLAAPRTGEPRAFVFKNILRRAFEDFAGEAELSPHQIRQLAAVDIPDYFQEAIPVMTFSEQTGFTRNLPEDLFKPFGKS